MEEYLPAIPLYLPTSRTRPDAADAVVAEQTESAPATRMRTESRAAREGTRLFTWRMTIPRPAGATRLPAARYLGWCRGRAAGSARRDSADPAVDQQHVGEPALGVDGAPGQHRLRV